MTRLELARSSRETSSAWLGLCLTLTLWLAGGGAEAEWEMEKIPRKQVSLYFTFYKLNVGDY